MFLLKKGFFLFVFDNFYELVILSWIMYNYKDDEVNFENKNEREKNELENKIKIFI